MYRFDWRMAFLRWLVLSSIVIFAAYFGVCVHQKSLGGALLCGGLLVVYGAVYLGLPKCFVYIGQPPSSARLEPFEEGQTEPLWRDDAHRSEL